MNRLLAPTGFELRRVRRRRARQRRAAARLGGDRAHDRLLEAPTFLLASIRSGSTLLRVLLNSHSQLHAPHELHLRGVRVRLSSEYAAQAMSELGLDETALEYLLWDRLLHRELARSGKRYIVNKTPSDVFIWRRIIECWPDARFIFLLRHPAAIARSRQGATRRESPETNLAKVLRFMNALERARENLDGLTVRYEDLTVDPEGTTQAICSFLGVEWEPEMLDYQRVDHGRYVPGLGDWGKRIKSGEIQRPAGSPREDEVPDALRGICEAWGYLSSRSAIR